jgi:hypothetical protein
VPEPLLQVQRAPVGGVELDALPLAERGRALPDVDHHVEYRAGHAHQVLGLAGRYVGEVHAAHRVARGHRQVGLGQLEGPAGRGGEQVEPVHLDEAAPGIGVLDRGDLVGTFDGQRADLHRTPP